MDSEGEEAQIKSIEVIKGCGITYSYNEDIAYQLNITDKITMLQHKSNVKIFRNFTKIDTG